MKCSPCFVDSAHAVCPTDNILLTNGKVKTVGGAKMNFTTLVVFTYIVNRLRWEGLIKVHFKTTNNCTGVKPPVNILNNTLCY